ncbi:PaaI family thioesterase [Sphingomonas immobilis]|uniref:Medium/long-chain acyl-CoA thioesterase YigI n=1 Tax=Sphingomonas immobilis TaxID=3063997 RepID=A0ABT8ZY67_9SPHN|nr:PaaI family thioesterase [Sphingomonas sp. CA1-15]MDO7842223.1 PaaI family thioesterase [Sphingomonas sp. CA1-15]
MTPRNPDFAADIAASFARQGALATIGAELGAVTAGRCEVRLPITDKVRQQQGFVHGGMVGLIGDVAGGYAAMTMFDPGKDVLTLEYKINFLRPAQGEMLIATGTVVRAGRSVAITRADVEAIAADGTRTLCAILQQSSMPG